MLLSTWSVYFPVVALVIIAPGPSAALCLSHGLLHGPWRTTSTVLGGMIASLSLMALSAVGLGVLLATSSTLFAVVKIIGAVYLIGLGIATWRSTSASTFLTRPASDAAATGHRSGAVRLLRAGFLIGISNPKDLLFFSALFPQFLEPTKPIAPQIAVLAITWLVIDGAVMMSYALVGSRLTGLIRSAKALRIFNRVTGGAFVAAGGAIALSHK